MRYTVILEQDADGGYVAHVPALPGCVTQGHTRAEVLAKIREAIELYVEDCRDAGDPVPTDLSGEPSVSLSNVLASFCGDKRAVI
jgi:predicted RNase H-like HicB family nuclease